MHFTHKVLAVQEGDEEVGMFVAKVYPPKETSGTKG